MSQDLAGREILGLINVSQLIHFDATLCHIRAGGKGTAGTAMAVPVFEGEKMASLGF